MILLDVVIAGLLAITSSYCWRLNRKIAGFRNAKAELEHMIRSFDASIRQAYESIAILKENSNDKNIQLIRDMEKVRFLANDLAFLVEKGEKLADSLEASVRQPRNIVEEYAAPVAAAQQSRPRPMVRPAPQRRPQPQMQPQFQQPEQQVRMPEPRYTVETLARSYVADDVRPQARPQQQYQPAPPSLPLRNSAAQAVRQQIVAAPAPSAQPYEQRAQAIEKVLNHIAAQNERGRATMPAVPPREMTQPQQPKAPLSPRPVAAAAVSTNKRFFDTLRVVTPDE